MTPLHEHEAWRALEHHHNEMFDIDGTLISTGGASDRAWRRAFEELHGAAVDVGKYTGTGVTDPELGLTSFRRALGREPSRREMASEDRRPF